MFFHSRELVGERGTNIFVRNLNLWAGPYPFSGLLKSIFFVMHVLGGDDCFYFFHLQTKLYSQAVSGWFTLPWHFSSGAFHSSSEGLSFFASLLSSVWVLSQPVGCEWWILPVRSPEVLTAHAAVIQKTHSYAFLRCLLGWTFCTMPDCFVWSLVTCFCRVRGCHLLKTTLVHVLNKKISYFTPSFSAVEGVTMLRLVFFLRIHVHRF